MYCRKDSLSDTQTNCPALSGSVVHCKFKFFTIHMQFPLAPITVSFIEANLFFSFCLFPFHIRTPTRIKTPPAQAGSWIKLHGMDLISSMSSDITDSCVENFHLTS